MILEETLNNAHNYAKENVERAEEGGYDISEEMKLVNAYLAGAKEGSQLDMVWHDYDAGEDCYEDTHEGRWIKRENDKPKWHDLRKDPNDLPEPYMSIVNQDGRMVRYDYHYKVWRNDDADDGICDMPIAWCEIPTYSYTEEEAGEQAAC